MKMIKLVIAGCVIFLSCDNRTKNNASARDTIVAENHTFKNDSMVKKEITWKKLFSGNQCNIEKSLNLVITGQGQFDSVWSAAFKTDKPHEKPVVNFTKNSVIALFLGTVNSGGHSIEITSITKDFRIMAEHSFPGKSCISTTAIEFPYYFALTDVAKSGITAFTINMKEVECE